MNQAKIGSFISECRRNKGLTQAQLAEKLNITDRAVSKWETGRAMPDSSIMLKLCEILEITVNDLLSGEVVTVDNYNKELENKLLQIVEQKQQADKRLLTIEIVTGVLCVGILLALCIVVSCVQMEEWLRILLAVIGSVPILLATPFMLKIEQTAGYYECAKCGNKYVPTYKSVFLSMHMGRTRYMKCPKCKQKSWNKKVISKE
ncbi:MAG: helix-turn-helix transcriptional regulator [Clostridia bacterium]|nr:helix-turn-helix transcriptional regulator [Clostridia bacterium]